MKSLCTEPGFILVFSALWKLLFPTQKRAGLEETKYEKLTPRIQKSARNSKIQTCQVCSEALLGDLVLHKEITLHGWTKCCPNVVPFPY